MKSLVASVLLLCFFSTASADFNISSSRTVTDDTSGLDWLKLSETAGGIYERAELDNIGWRYATNLEVEGMFSQLFNFYEDTNTTQHIAEYVNNAIPGNPDRYMVSNAQQFERLFGVTTRSYSGVYVDVTTSFGYYRDEDGILRSLGVSTDQLFDTVTGERILINNYTTYSDEYTRQYAESFNRRNTHGTFLVRDSEFIEAPVESVPEASSLYLLAFGLLGLFGAARRKV